MSNTAAKSPVASIVLHRAEGLIAELKSDGDHTVASYADANAILRRWSETAPKGGGYDKCDITVTWANGKSYRVRYDLKHIDPCNVADAVASEVEFYAGTYRPAHLTADVYEQILACYPADRRPRLAAMRAECDFTV